MQLTIKDEGTGALKPGQGEDGLPIQQTEQTQQQEQDTDPAAVAKALADTKAALTKAQQELAELKKPTEQEPATTTEEAPEVEADKTAEGKQLEITEEQVKQVEAMDFSAEQAEFTQTMDVSEESRAKVAEKLKGVFGDQARSIVDDYIEGAKVRTQNAVNTLMESAGGKDQYGQMVEWAKTSLSRAEKEAFNKAVNSNDLHAAGFAISGLRQKFEAAGQRAPQLLDGSGRAPSGAVYRSTAEMQKDMSDPRYKKDPVFRKEVQDKLMRSDIL